MRDQIEVGEMRLPFQSERPQRRESGQRPLRADRVAVPDEHPLPAQPLDSVPPPAHQRQRVSVLVRRHVVEYVLYHLIWEVAHLSFLIKTKTKPPKKKKVLTFLRNTKGIFLSAQQTLTGE